MSKIWEYLALNKPDIELCDVEKGRKAIVVATGHTIWEDLLKAGYKPNTFEQNYDIITVNRAIQDITCKVKHGYSNHAPGLDVWAKGRDEVHQKKEKYMPSPILHSNRNFKNVLNWPLPGTGTSTLNAVYLALALGYEEIKVCGVPMDNGPHYYDPPWHTTNFENHHHVRHWHRAYHELFPNKVEIISKNLVRLIKEYKR